MKVCLYETARWGRVGFQGRLLTHTPLRTSPPPPHQWRSHQGASEAGACTPEQEPGSKSLASCRVSRAPPTDKAYSSQQRQNISKAQISFHSKDEMLNLQLSQSVSWNTIGLGMLLAFSECGQGMLYLR